MFAARLDRREVVEPGQQLAAALHPVVHEGELHLRDHRPLHAHHRLAPVVLLVGVAEPLVRDADAAGEADRAVDDEELAVRAVVEAREGVPAQRVVPLHVDAVALHEVDQRVRHRRGADGVEDHFHRHAGAGALRQRLREEPPDLAVPVDVELEVDGLLRAADGREHRWEDLHAVFQDLHAVAGRHRRAAERVHGLQEGHVAHAELVLHVVAHRQPPPDDRQRRSLRIARLLVPAEKHQRWPISQTAAATRPAMTASATPTMMAMTTVAAPATAPTLRGGRERSR